MWGWIAGPSEPVAVTVEGVPGREGIRETLISVRNDSKARLQSEEGWEDVALDAAVHGDTKLQCKQEGDLLAYKCVGSIAGVAPEDILKLFWNKDLAARQVWDTSLADYRLVEEISKECEVVYSDYAAGVPLVSNRIFVIARTFWRLPDGNIDYVGTSLNHEKALQDPAAVRGTSTVYFEWRKIATGTLVSQFLSADPRGSLPTFLINSIKTKTAEQIVAMRKVLGK